ncbi:MAG: rhomboid family intramembrane serine protease [Actinomycetota bacterium]
MSDRFSPGDPPPEQPGQLVEDQGQSDETYCVGHPDRPTKLRCSRCDRPICGQCAIPASVGQHCPWCVAEARKSHPKVRTAMQASAPGVRAIIGLNVVAWVAQLIASFTATQQIDPVTLRFALIPPEIANGEWWRLITSMFLHATTGPFLLLHILFNCYILYIYGPEVEKVFGTRKFLTMYLAAGFLGSAFSYAFGPFIKVGLGASGAVFGMVGVLIAYLFSRRSSALVTEYLRSLVFFVGINLVFGFIVAGIDNFAHIGGLVAGLGLGFVYDLAQRRNAPVLEILATLALIGAGVVLVALRTASPAGILS